MPVRVRLASAMRAMPKSVTLTLSPVRSAITLAGLMSRCTTPCAMGMGQRVGDARADAQHHRHRQQVRRLRVVPQVAALQVFHGDPGHAVVLAGVEHADDARVLQAARRLGLAQEAAARLGRGPRPRTRGRARASSAPPCARFPGRCRGRARPSRRARARARRGSGRCAVPPAAAWAAARWPARSPARCGRAGGDARREGPRPSASSTTEARRGPRP